MGKKKDCIQCRIKKSDETCKEDDFLRQINSWNAIVNRLYYSCFYVVIALLLKDNIKIHTHHGALNQFGLQLIKTKKINLKYGTLYSRLFDFRQKGDYGDMFDFSENDVLPLIDEVQEFIEEIKKHIWK